ncbi:hypothetical protein J6590_036284 [Homalodisca vitripennis]|nr:hypothetical protein J6590_036284 [Homalodisca vitripennis]
MDTTFSIPPPGVECDALGWWVVAQRGGGGRCGGIDRFSSDSSTQLTASESGAATGDSLCPPSTMGPATSREDAEEEDEESGLGLAVPTMVVGQELTLENPEENQTASGYL